ncbi:MAG TPA: heparinase II/III family protein, partial [Luteitalea sp.]|nr:heparinase II/III family protein [Luteitalea sp.]
MPSPALIARKLRRMSPGEIVGRIGDLGTRIIEEQRYRAGMDRDPEPSLTNPGPPSFGYPFFAEHDLTTVTSALASDTGYVARLRSEADALCRGEFSFFGRAFTLNPARIPWTADPITGRPWPMVFHTKVDIFSGNVGHGDVKFVWELNRHQFLPTLGKAWRLTGEARYAETALDWIDQWIAENPYKVGINWASALEVAVRSLAWLWSAALLDDAAAFTAERRIRLRRALHHHAAFLASHLSFYFSPYNHLIGEATALHAIGTLVPSLAAAPRWRDRGWQILCAEVEKQFHPDGGTVEQAFGYHHFTLGFYLQSLLIARRHGQAVPPTLSARLAAAWRYSAAITRPDGQVPMVGDADEGRALALDQNHLWDFRSYQAVGAIV